MDSKTLLLIPGVLFNIIIQTIVLDDGLNLIRFIIIPLLLAAALYHKLWVRIIVMLVILGLILYTFSVNL